MYNDDAKKSNLLFNLSMTHSRKANFLQLKAAIKFPKFMASYTTSEVIKFNAGIQAAICWLEEENYSINLQEIFIA